MRNRRRAAAIGPRSYGIEERTLPRQKGSGRASGMLRPTPDRSPQRVPTSSMYPATFSNGAEQFSKRDNAGAWWSVPETIIKLIDIAPALDQGHCTLLRKPQFL